MVHIVYNHFNFPKSTGLLLLANQLHVECYFEVRASQLAQASERVGSPIPASQQG